MRRVSGLAGHNIKDHDDERERSNRNWIEVPVFFSGRFGLGRGNDFRWTHFGKAFVIGDSLIYVKSYFFGKRPDKPAIKNSTR